MVRKIFRIAVLAWMVNFVLVIFALMISLLTLSSDGVAPDWIELWYETTMTVAFAYPLFALVAYRKVIWKEIKKFVNGN